MMRAMAAAAGRQARFVTGRQDGRERSQPVQQNQRNGEYAPHRRIFIYGNETVRVKQKVVVRSSGGTRVCAILIDQKGRISLSEVNLSVRTKQLSASTELIRSYIPSPRSTEDMAGKTHTG